MSAFIHSLLSVGLVCGNIGCEGEHVYFTIHIFVHWDDVLLKGVLCEMFTIASDEQNKTKLPFLHIDMMVLVQAEKASWNSIGIFKVDNITGKRRNLVPKSATDDAEMDSDNSDSEDDSDNEDPDSHKAPILQALSCKFGFFILHFLVLT